jgi:hypothetical protein
MVVGWIERCGDFYLDEPPPYTGVREPLGELAEEYLEMHQAEPVTMGNVRFPPSPGPDASA